MNYFVARQHFGSLRPNRNIPIVLTAAALLAASTIFGLVVLLLQKDTPEPSKVTLVTATETVDILVPLSDINLGTKLKKQLFATIAFPKAALPQNAIRSSEQIQNAYAKTLLLKSQPFTTQHLQNTASVNSLIDRIPPGYRAVTIRVDERSSQQGWIQPGAHVDVNWMTNINGKPALITIVANAEVLAIEDDLEANPDHTFVPHTITLLTSIEDAKKIDLALANGSLALHLRGENDDGVKRVDKPMTLTEMIGSTPSPAPKAGVVGTLLVDGQKYDLTEDGKIQQQK